MVAALASLSGFLLEYCDTIGLPERTRFSISLGSTTLAIWIAGTVAESCVILFGLLLLSEYRELRSETTVVLCDAPKPRRFRALPPDQYRFQPELLRVLPPRAGGGPRGCTGRGCVGRGWLTVGAKETPFSSRCC